MSAEPEKKPISPEIVEATDAFWEQCTEFGLSVPQSNTLFLAAIELHKAMSIDFMERIAPKLTLR